MNLKLLTLKYFKLFQKKKINDLETLFDSNIELIDPGNKIKGKNKVLKFNSNFFNSYKSIKIKVLFQAINEKERTTFSYINVILNKKKFHVVDLLQFTKNNKIKKIIAFKK
tara:strand:- start:1842 stop:2174 length:333 start_codon:yes stop_codon:yes gene_type:complete